VIGMRAVAVAAACLVLSAQVTFASESKLPDESRVSYQEAFPGTRDRSQYRLPAFMDVFAAWTAKEYINVGLKWNVIESKAAMAYATRLSAGHNPIVLETDDYHIEAFSGGKDDAKGDGTKHTKIRFRQKATYSGTLAYAEPIQDQKAPDKAHGQFVFWDNKAKASARVMAGQLTVQRNSVFEGEAKFKGKAVYDSTVEAKEIVGGGTRVGASTAGAKIEAPAGKGLGLYTTPPGGAFTATSPQLFITNTGSIGIGTMKPVASLHIATGADKKALRVQSGQFSVGATSTVEIDGQSDAGVAVIGKRLKITDKGLIGINNPTPTETLDVSGAARFDTGAAKFGKNTKSTVFVTNELQECTTHAMRVKDALYVASCNRVGINTANPQADLHVTGVSKTDTLTVDKDATIAGKLTTGELTALKGLLAANSLVIESTGNVKGKMEVGDDLVVKGNLWVGKEVKMVGGNDSDLMESRLALLEESHSTLKEHNSALHKRVTELESLLETMQS